MKKSTLFFKVMVLLALLVPWTGWGQSQLPEGIDENDVIADKIMVLDSNGEIPGDNSGATEEQKGKNVKLETFHFKTGYDYNDWTFVNEVKPSDSGITVKIQGGNTMLSLSGSPKSEVDAIYIKIKNTEGDEKWVRYGFVQSGSSVISASYTTGGDSKVYNGRNISEEEVKVGLKVVSTKYEIGQDNEETTLTTYSVTIPDNAKNVGTYEITITAEGSTATVEYEITKRPVTVTLDGLKLEKGANGTNLNASDYASYFKIEEENNESKSGLVSEEKAKVTGTFDIDTQTVGDASFSTDDLDVVPDNSSFASENYTIKWDGKATITKKDFSEGGEGGQGGTIIVTVVDKTYNGKPVDSPEVKDSETTLEKDKDYTVTYKDENEKDLKMAPSNAGTYTVVITPTESGDYEGSPIEKNFTISKAKVTVAGTLTITEGDKLKDSYKFDDIKDLKAEGIVEGEEETVKAAITITPKNKENPTASDDAFTITLAETEGNYEISEGSKIALVVEEDPDKWQEGEAKAEVTVYVNEEGSITKVEDPSENITTSVADGILTVKFAEELVGWKYSTKTIEEGGTQTSSVVIDDADSKYTWDAVGVGENLATILKVSGKDVLEGESAVVKAKIENGESEGYLQITFVKDESSEEPGGDDDAWATTDGNEKANLTVYVNEDGDIVGSDKIELETDETESYLRITTENVELEEGWTFAKNEEDVLVLWSENEGWTMGEPFSWELTTESTSSSSNTYVKLSILGEENVYKKLPGEVRIKVVGENDEEGYISVDFQQVVTIRQDDINKGGDDENGDGEIGDGEAILIKGATGSEYAVYDAESHGLGMLEVTIADKTTTLTENEHYSVEYIGGEGTEPVDAGKYTAKITFKEEAGYFGVVTLENSVVIAPRPLKLQFSFDEVEIKENDKLVLGTNVFMNPVEGTSFANEDEAKEFESWLENGRISAEFEVLEDAVNNEYPVVLKSISFPKEGTYLKYSNYDVTYVAMTENLTPDTTEEHPLLDPEEEKAQSGNNDYTHDGDGDIIGGYEPVDNSGHGTITGTNYRKNRLYLADRDFYFNDLYDEEGLILYSRHDKKYTEDGGSFTIWYEHNGEVNEGGYRIFISSKKNKDYKEVKLDEVSGYYQIRNVQSDIYVKIYAMDGFPVANEEITATDARAYAQANKIVVITPEPTDVQIISMAGAVVATDQVTGQREFANLAEGVYIVRMGETVIKLQVRN